MEIGSLTKIFTALLIAEAVRRNELELSNRIDTVLFGQHWSGEPAITVEELATHTSGLPRLSFGLWRALQADPYLGYTRTTLLLYLEQTQPRSPKSPAYSYSNLGYAVLGLLLEKSASLPFEQLLQERLLNPMGMANTGLQLAEGRDQVRRGFTSSGAQASLWHMDAYAPCGAMISTLEDLVLAARSLLDARSPIAASLALTTEPRAAVPGGSIGLAWMLPAAGAAYWHNGATAGYCAYFGVNTRRRVAAIVLANQSRAPQISELGIELMRHIRAVSTASEGAG
jgi:CubicO group peptidase (beta-lactamase class C family)